MGRVLCDWPNQAAGGAQGTQKGLQDWLILFCSFFAGFDDNNEFA
jgi:hypothetical protein